MVSKIKVESIGPDSGSSYNKWKRVGIDDHLRASIAAGIIKLSGSSRYLTDRYKMGQTTRTLVIRLESRKELLDLLTVNQEDIAVLCGAREKNQELFSQATHLILGIVYGTEAYCVLTQDLTNREENETGEEAEENLSKITLKMEIALKENQNLAVFMEQFDDKEIEQLAGVKCRLYADFHSQFVRECSVMEAYKHCLHLIQETQNLNSKVIPIFVALCPIKFMLASAGIVRVLEYQNVDPDLVMDCCRILDNLDRITAMADAACETGRKIHRLSLRRFREAVAGYQEVLQKSLANQILKARETVNSDGENIKQIVEMAQNHPLFKPFRLERWLRYKQSELELAEKMIDMKGIMFFANRNEVEKELANTLDKNFALVLRIPSVDEDTNAMLEAMRKYVCKCTELTPECCEDDANDNEKSGISEDGLPWHMDQHKRKQVFDEIRQFANHVEKNKHLEAKLQYLITFDDPGKGGSRYSVYEADNLLKDNLDALPHPPTDLLVDYPTMDNVTTELKSSTLRVLWNYQDMGYPCHFLVEFRPKGSCDKSWMQRKTTIPGENQTIISFQKGLAIEIRVAADTCIGRSDFTCIFDTGFIAAENYACKDVVHYHSYCAKEDAIIREELWLNYPSYAKLFFSMNSRFNPRPENRRIAEIFAMDNSRLIQRGKPNIHLLNVRENSTNGDFRWMDIGRINVSKPADRRDHKVIMLTGARGSGKSTLIDGMINYILGVQWKDPFRFKCIRQDHSISKNHLLIQTSSVTAYTIRHRDGMAIPYSITIIDTPGYVNKEDNKENMRKIQRFLTQKNIRIDQIHAICFVAASNDMGSMKMEPFILDSGLSLFAKDVKDNIRLLVTSADMSYPAVDTCSDAKCPVTSTGFTYNKFDNSVLYASNEQQGEEDSCFDQLFWQMGQDNFRKFFVGLEKMKGRDLESTREVIQRRLLLDQSLKDIERGLEVYLVNVENILMFRRKISEYSDKMEANKHFLVDKMEIRRRKVNCDKGLMAYNCRHCRRTCEGPMRSISFVSIRKIKKQCCHIFCPCPASQHDYQRFQWRQVCEKVTTTLEEMKAEYESNYNDKLTTEQLLMDCQHELKMTKAELFCLLARVGSNCLLLEATALRPNTLSLADYLSLIRNRVAEESAPGYLTRLEILTELQQSLTRCAPENNAVQPVDIAVYCDGKKMGSRPYQLQLIETFANSFGIGDC